MGKIKAEASPEQGQYSRVSKLIWDKSLGNMVCLKVKKDTKIIKYQFNSVCLYCRLVKAMCQIVLFTLIYHQTWAHSSIKINILPFYLLSIFLLSWYCAGSPYRIPISSAILQLQEAGRLHILKNRWWKEKSPKQCNVRSDLPIVPSLDYFCIIFRWRWRKVQMS